MVGLVIVSHSRALADALVGLLRQVASADLPIAVAAGIGENRSEFGTDAMEIMEAIQSVYSDEGVLVLMDLGSAVLSANMALEFLPPEMAEKIRFCGAPLVEGAVAAAVPDTPIVAIGGVTAGNARSLIGAGAAAVAVVGAVGSAADPGRATEDLLRVLA